MSCVAVASKASTDIRRPVIIDRIREQPKLDLAGSHRRFR